MTCIECGTDALIVTDCADCGSLGSSAKCDECGAYAENPAHAGH
jgi:predicted RNA-binding Zn-ribbon protein involved in translation (DUF1610 family)